MLNLRELEQALDNVRRLSGLDANIDIAPAAREGEVLGEWRLSRRLDPMLF